MECILCMCVCVCVCMCALIMQKYETLLTVKNRTRNGANVTVREVYILDGIAVLTFARGFHSICQRLQCMTLDQRNGYLWELYLYSGISFSTDISLALESMIIIVRTVIISNYSAGRVV